MKYTKQLSLKFFFNLKKEIISHIQTHEKGSKEVKSRHFIVDRIVVAELKPHKHITSHAYTNISGMYVCFYRERRGWNTLSRPTGPSEDLTMFATA